MLRKKQQQKQDAGESLFTARMSEYIETTVYSKEYPEIGFRKVFPVNNEGGPGIKYITYRLLDRTGTAQAMADAADDFPRVNLSAREFSAPVHSYGNSAVWTQDEVDLANRNNINLESEDAEAMRDAYERRCDQIASVGDAVTKLPGFNTNPNIPLVAPTTGTPDNTWPSKTADQVIADVGLLLTAVVAQSMGTHAATALILSPARLMYLSTVRVSNTANNLMWYLNQNYAGMVFIAWQRMATAGAGGVQRIAAMQVRKDVAEFREPTPFELMPVERRGMKWIMNGRGRIGGVVVRKPLACAFMDGI